MILSFTSLQKIISSFFFSEEGEWGCDRKVLGYKDLAGPSKRTMLTINEQAQCSDKKYKKEEFRDRQIHMDR